MSPNEVRERILWLTPERDEELHDLDCFLELALRKRYKTYDEFHKEFGNFVYESEERYLMYFEDSDTFDIVTTQELKPIYNSVKRYKPA